MGYPLISLFTPQSAVCGCKSRRSDLPARGAEPYKRNKSAIRPRSSAGATPAGRFWRGGINRRLLQDRECHKHSLQDREMCAAKRKPHIPQFRLCPPDAKIHPKGGESLQYPNLIGGAGANSGTAGNGLRRPIPRRAGYPSCPPCQIPDRADKPGLHLNNPQRFSEA
ncbi:hypothetical protein ATHL_02339 [Anaerolinea thermolimosa]|nr:hypothetical protein ATHL_02339 [Anaerolinea thermolimosa]